jgi:triosephosphate isomerase
MARRPLVAGNWKMHTTLDEAMDLAERMVDQLDAIEGVDKVVCPPFVHLFSIAEFFEDTSIKVGAQNMHWETRGAYTGEVSPLMIRDFCDYVILGHSERRRHFCETDSNVNRKVLAALAHDLIPIVCVGETLEEREAGLTDDVIKRQLMVGIQGVDREVAHKLVVAYEPVWAIGTGRPSTGQEANRVVGFLRELMVESFGTEAGHAIRFLYGGSVSADNIEEFVSFPEIDGALVGGASLRAGEFVSIVEQVARIRG